MQTVVYVSSATRNFSSVELIELLEVSRRNNAAAGVTGMLLYNDGNFMQALEGEASAVQSVYARIAADDRHSGVLRLLREQSNERRFANWSMGFRRVEELPKETLAHFSDLLSDSFVAPVFTGNPQRAWRLLLEFRDSMR